VGFDALWELDFWGRIRNGVDASEALFNASVADYDNLLVTLTGDVGRSYILMRTLEERLAIVKKNIATQQRSLEIAQVRFDRGLTTELDVQQAKALLYNTQSALPVLNTATKRTRNTISVLIGRAPGTLDEILGGPGTIPVAEVTIAADVPASLIRRRPDIRRAEMLASAQASMVGVSKADMYPAFRLLGSIGYVADSTGNLFEGDSVSGVAGFGMMWKFLNYGRLKNNVRIQDARFQQSINGYQLAVLAAVREVEDSLVAFSGAKAESILKEQSAIAAERAVELALTLYRDGVTDYTTVITTQRILFLQQGAFISAKGDAVMKLISAYKALGGGWQQRGSQPFINSENMSDMTERTNWGDLLQ
jgi:NodT family efflux transporter outer membrane factor (OMF) lipoprotein